MLSDTYKNRLQQKIRTYFPSKEIQICIFGSALSENHFQDIDVALYGDFEKKTLRNLAEDFYESTFPFIVDLVNLNEVEEDFRQSVLNNQPKIWI